MNRRAKDFMVAFGSAAVVLIAVYYGLFGRSQKINLDIDQILGTVTAEETAKLIGSSKGRVLVMARDTGADKIPSLEAELDSFAQTLRTHRELKLLPLKVPISPMQMMSTGGGLPEEELFKALRTHTNVNALVLFMAFPSLSDAAVEEFKKTAVQTVVVSSFRPDYKRLLDRGVIHLAIVPRPDTPPADAPTARNLRERFDQEYAVVRRSEE
jgi:hypothetical protein